MKMKDIVESLPVGWQMVFQIHEIYRDSQVSLKHPSFSVSKIFSQKPDLLFPRISDFMQKKFYNVESIVIGRTLAGSFFN